MKPLFVALALALAGPSAVAAEVENHGTHPFTIRDLVMMDRVGDPQLSPDGRQALYTVRATDYAANKGVTSIYVLDVAKGARRSSWWKKRPRRVGRPMVRPSITLPTKMASRSCGVAPWAHRPRQRR